MIRRSRLPLFAVLACLCSALAAPAWAQAGEPPILKVSPPAGAQVLKYRFGPIKVQPGQNLIDINVQTQRPSRNGWIVGFRPGLVDADSGRSPSVDVVHLHHAVWLVGEPGRGLRPVYAAGEEKTAFRAPPGFGWRYTTDQTWLINHMLHDLVGSAHSVYITYELWFIPDSAPEAADITRIDTRWMDVEGLKPYPVFNAVRGTGGADRRFTFPDEATDPYPSSPPRNRWVVDRDATLVSTAGHLHPGGLWTDLKLTRNGRTVNLFRSRAHYYEPAGAVSWDVSMTATRPTWRVAVRKGDILSTSATYDTRSRSWYEVMGIMVVGMTQTPKGGVDPFTGKVDRRGVLTHGRLPENIDRGVGEPNPGLSNPLRLRNGPYVDRVVIRNFAFEQGDLSRRGTAGLPPAVRQGQQLEFVNADQPLTIRFHTITACRAPCNRTGGIRYPLADGRVAFDSGELGFGPSIATSGVYESGDGRVPLTAAVPEPADPANCVGLSGSTKIIANGCVGSASWKTPASLRPGTYTFFCRVHPFMRGAFRVVRSGG
ncbi:unannotated protein [freshwater metagenome]|uniref:Unannotated protein n=1 Tax=freshwater metagenome TaxID=449393 RepID=A0A6J7I113_9ZZZZ|nr:hypothetical protein [Actinomycetota bacterium]